MDLDYVLIATGATGAYTTIFLLSTLWRWLRPVPSHEVFFSPKGGCTEVVVREIGKARHEVLVLAYSFTSKPIADAAPKIMAVIDALRPAGRTPLTSAVAEAADALDYRHKPARIVVLTDGEETCGGNPCSVAAQLHNQAEQLTIDVIGLRVKNYAWMGDQGIIDAKCLAETNGGEYLPVDTLGALREALEKTLGCPMVTEASPSPGEQSARRSSPSGAASPQALTADALRP